MKRESNDWQIKDPLAVQAWCKKLLGRGPMAGEVVELVRVPGGLDVRISQAEPPRTWDDTVSQALRRLGVDGDSEQEVGS